MIKYIQIFLIFFISACSLNSSSSLWTSHKKIEREKSLNIRQFNKTKEILKNEINTDIKLKLNYTNKMSNLVKNLTNNTGLTNYDGELKRVSKYNFSKIKYFNQYDPEIIVNNKKIIFFDNKGAILNFNEDSKLIWKKNYYNKSDKKNNPILFFAQNNKNLVVADTLANYYLINIQNGNLRWFKNNISPFNSQIKIYNDFFYVVDDSNILNCFSINSGEKKWSYKTGKTLIKSQKRLSLVIKDNRVIFINTLGDITALDAITGKLIWQTPTQSRSVYEDAMFLKISDLVISDQSILFSNNMNEFFSININSGVLNWKQSVNSSLRPVRINDFIFTVSEEGYLIIVDFMTGSIIRSTYLFKNLKKKKRLKIRPTGFIVGKKNIYLSTSIGRLFIVDIKTGNTQSVIKIDNQKISRPVASKEKLFIVKDNSIIKLN